MRTDIDHGKHQRLRLELSIKRAAMTGVSALVTQNLDALREMEVDFSAHAPRLDDYHGGTPAQFLAAFDAAKPNHQAAVASWAASARHAVALRAELAALRAQLETQRPAVDALAHLIAALDKYVNPEL